MFADLTETRRNARIHLASKNFTRVRNIFKRKAADEACNQAFSQLLTDSDFVKQVHEFQPFAQGALLSLTRNEV